jgi:predicted nucleic acid-binding protein
VVREVARGRLGRVWDSATRRETEAVLRRIPRLDWERFAPLFEAAGEHGGAVEEADAFGYVDDPGDRKFAALAAASGAVLVTNDRGLLAHRGRHGLRVATPAEVLAEGGEDGGTEA